MDGTNSVFAKVWLADWATPEPTNWQLVWADSALSTPKHTGFAGLTAPSNGADAQYEVSYVLIKAAGLPNITPTAAATTPGMQAPFFLNPAVTLTSSSSAVTAVNVNWFGAASLVAAPTLAGPWTNVVSTTNSYVTPKANFKPAEFYRLFY